MDVRVRPYQLVIQLLATHLLGDVKAARGPLKPVSMFESCGDKIEVGKYEGYRLDILGAELSDLRSECEVKFYGSSSVFYLVKNVKNSAERVVVYIKTRPRHSHPAHFITKETIDHKWRRQTGQSEPASGGISTIIHMIRSSGRSRDFSMTMEIFGEDYNTPIDPHGTAKRMAIAVGILAGIGVIFACLAACRSFSMVRCRNHHRGRRESSSPINVASSTVSSHQNVPTLTPIQRNPYTGNIEPYSGERDEYSDLLGDTASNPHQAQSGQSRHSQRRDDDPPSYYTTLSRALNPQLAITAPDDCLPAYNDALKFENLTSHS